MCYHTLYIFLACGHSVPSLVPLAHRRSPPCPARSRALYHNPSLASPISPGAAPAWAATPESETPPDAASTVVADDSAVCNEKLSHPLHTYRVAGLCLQCQREREERLARFEVGSIKNGVEREDVMDASRRQRRKSETEKVKVGTLGLRSGYMEGRGRG